MENEKIKKKVKMECIQNTADDKMQFEKGKVYDLPEDHPCLEYFKPVTYTVQKPPGLRFVGCSDGRKH